MLTPALDIDWDTIVGVKVYPDGATTGSHGSGVRTLRAFGSVLEEMQERGMPLLIHAEDPEVPPIGREEAWLLIEGEWVMRA